MPLGILMSTTGMKWYPLIAATIAIAIAVLPEEDSTRVVCPGRISPRSSACSIMFIAGRALTDQPGLVFSSFIIISGGESRREGSMLTRGAALRRGVEPKRSSMLS